MRGDIRREKVANGQAYPHLYALLTLDSILALGPVEPGDVIFKLPVAG